jgi:hypothetical protein
MEERVGGALGGVGSGEAAFNYLAPYVFRVAISNSRIVKLEDGRVTFKYKDSIAFRVLRLPCLVTCARMCRTELRVSLVSTFVPHLPPELSGSCRYDTSHRSSGAGQART